MKNKLILLIVSIFSLTIQAQDFEFKKVSKAELEEQYHPLDSVAPAATLFEKGHLDFKYTDGWEYELEVTKRLKIYNSDGYDYATIELPYYYGDTSSEQQDIYKIKAYVYNLDGNKVKDKKLRKNDFIDEKVSEVQRKVKFTFPNLKPGSVIEYTYILKSPFISSLPEWKFQDEIPVNYSKYEIIIPEDFGYNERAKGFYPIHKDTENISIRLNYRMDADTKYNPGVGSLSSESGTLKRNAIKYKYEAKDVPKLKDEPFVNNHKNFMTSIKHELAYSKNIQYGSIKQYTTNWEKVGKRLQDADFFGKELDKNKYYQEDIDKILSQSPTANEKIINIFNHVKNHMSWNEYNSIYCSDKLRKVYKERTGNIADINLMLTSMLRYAGFEAHPVLVSTISHGIPSTVASTSEFNYIICAIELSDDQIVLLDASNPFTAPNILPTKCLNWNGQLIRPNGTSRRIALNPKRPSKDNFIMNIKVMEDGSLTGQMRRQYTNQYAYRYRTAYTSVNKEEYINALENEIGVKINDYKIQNIENLSKPVVETLSFEKQDAVDVINNNIYMSPLLFLAKEENPFKQNQENRKLPIDFTFPKSRKYMINIDVPDTYQVDYIPEPTAISLPNDKGFYQFNILETPNGDLQIVVKQDIKQSILTPEYYLPIKEFFKIRVQKETDKIVLIKK